jgi:hypothetical protein
MDSRYQLRVPKKPVHCDHASEQKGAQMSLLDKAQNDTGRKWEYSTEGDAIEGTVTAVSTFEGDYDPAPMITIDATTLIEGGNDSPVETIRILCGKTVLKRKVEEANLQVGDKVAIFYKGEKPKKKDPTDTYSDFGVAVERASLLGAASADGADW